MIRRYRRRISGPLLDRIDIHLEVPRVPYEKLAVDTVDTVDEASVEAVPGREVSMGAEVVGDHDRAAGAAGAALGVRAARSLVETSDVVRARVIAARQRQRQRLTGTGFQCNAEMGPAQVRRHCRTEPGAEALLRAAMQRLHLSARSYHRVLKLARTIADLAAADVVGAVHVAEALQYRQRAVE